MTNLILLFCAVLMLSICLNRISSKLGIPMLLSFIALGMLFGADGLLKISFDNFDLAEKVCSFALIFIMFYGGFGTNWRQARPVAGKAVLLSTVGVVLTALLTGLFCHFVLRIELLESLLIGSVVASTDAASVFAILRSRRLNLRYSTASLLEVESGSNDPCSYMLTIIMISAMSGAFSGGRLILLIVTQLLFGALAGVAIGIAGAFVLGKFKFKTDGFDTVFVFSVALFAYAGASLLGGNGYLSAYIAGVILGNRPIPNKKSLVHFFDGTTGLMQILLFFLLGLLAFPSKLPEVALPGLAIALFLTFIGRPAVIFLLLAPFRCPLGQRLLVSWAGLRGAASIVFAITVMVSPVATGNDVFHIVFFIVLFSIAIQGSLLPLLSRRMGMIDETGDVLKTFNDYTEELPVQLIQLSIGAEHRWAGRAIREIPFPPDLLLVLVYRGKHRLLPRGNTVLQPGDEVILSAPSPAPSHEVSIRLTEIPVAPDSEWLDYPLAELPLEPDKLVMVIRRGEAIVIPKGHTRIHVGDVLVIGQL